MSIKAPRPTLVQRGAAAVSRGIFNFSDEVYGNTPDREAFARQDRTSLQRIAVEDAQAREFLDEVMKEHTDLLSAEDEYGTEFTDFIAREFVRKYGRDLARSETRYIQEFVEDHARDMDGGRASEFLTERMNENTDLLSSEDPSGWEFRNCVARGFHDQFGREPSQSESRIITEFVSEWAHDCQWGEQ
ncbi:hypothetical protein GALL_297440 [mine drainage metagenome]|uniref:Uncharacterized protein n=1 Tax=mine drainage metagenome TaxID=410659 RepID=A0A1J5R8L9_9ZZZZ